MTQNNSSKILFYHLAQTATQEQAPPCYFQLQMHTVKPHTVMIKIRKKKDKLILIMNIILTILHIVIVKWKCHQALYQKSRLLTKTKPCYIMSFFPAPKMSDSSVLACTSDIFMSLSNFPDKTWYHEAMLYCRYSTCLFINAISKVNNKRIVLYNSRINEPPKPYQKHSSWELYSECIF